MAKIDQVIFSVRVWRSQSLPSRSKMSPAPPHPSSHTQDQEELFAFSMQVPCWPHTTLEGHKVKSLQLSEEWAVITVKFYRHSPGTHARCCSQQKPLGISREPPRSAPPAPRFSSRHTLPRRPAQSAISSAHLVHVVKFPNFQRVVTTGDDGLP